MESLANFIIRPKRAEYDPSNDLGPKQFYLNGMPKQRIDFELTNPLKQKLKCSMFAPSSLKQKFPCVVYCHGNSASRVEALEIVDLLLPHDIIVAALDFSGSGLSEGEYVTLGHNEKSDLKTLVEYLRKKDYITDIGLWGRSMGAVTSILFASKDHNIACMCLDSAFSNLPQLCIETMKNRTLGSFFGGMFMGSVRKTIKKKTDLELDDVSPVDCISHCKMPALFVHGRKDTIVSISHSQKLFSIYPGNAKIHEIETEHNDPRPKWVKQEIKNFFIHKFAEIRKKREFNETINSVLGEKLTNNKGNTRLEDFLNKMTYHDDDESPPSSPPKEQMGLNLGSLKGSYENTSPMTDRSNRGEAQVGTASIEAIVGNKLFMMMKKDADEAKKKKKKKKYADESDSDDDDDDDIPPFIKNKDRSEPKFVPFGKGAQALFDLKFKNGSFHNPRKVRNDSFSDLPKGYHKKFAAHECHSDGEM